MRNIRVDLTSTMQKTTIKFNKNSKKMINDRLGMFIHFGIYSELAGWRKGEKFTYGNAEWIMKHAEIPFVEYSSHIKDFNPDVDWAEKLAKEAKKAGMKYAVLTTKHHDGYCLFKSDYSVYNHYHTHGRDLVREYVDAMRKEGIEPGFYYSHALDWSERDGAGYHCLYFGGREVNNSNYWDYPNKDQKDFSRYFYGKCMPQVKELLTKYGDVYLMWFDYPHDITKGQAKELYKLVKDLQPNCLVNSRIGHGYGDYNSLGDNTVSTIPLGVPNECLVTLNDTWGFREYDHNWKTGEEIIDKLTRCTATESSFLVNVGPDKYGRVPKETSKVLTTLGKWTDRYMEVVNDSQRTPFLCGFEWGSASLSKDRKRLHLYVVDNDTEQICLNGIKGEVEKVIEVGGKEQEFDFVNEELKIKFNRKNKNAIIPVITVYFKEKASFSNLSIEHGDLLTLTPYYGKKFRIEGEEHFNVELVFEYNLYDPLWGKRGLGLGFNSAVISWESDKEYLEWQAEFTRDGEYECELVTTQMRGEGIAEVEIDGQVVEKTIKSDNFDRFYSLSRTGADNSRCVYNLGKVKVEKGLSTIFLRRKGMGANIPLIQLNFRKV